MSSSSAFAGEMAAAFLPNLIGNALDAMGRPGPGPGSFLSVRRSRSWRDPSVEGVRFFPVFDTGCGMSDEVLSPHFLSHFFYQRKKRPATGLGAMGEVPRLFASTTGAIRIPQPRHMADTKPLPAHPAMGTGFYDLLPAGTQ